jgi:acetyl-CoA acetyltransferase family protein
MAREAFLVGAVRTPHGRYGGSLRDVSLVELGGLAGAAAIDRAGLPAEAVEETIVSNCRQAGNGPNPGRQVSLRAGAPQSTPAQTINMACASGLKIIQLASQSVVSGGADTVLAVAAESMSTMPYLASYRLRWEGVRRGDIALVDGWRDGGTDPICGMNMGQTAEKISREYGVDRAAQDAWAARSHQRVQRAWEENRFDAEVLPVDTDDGTLERDETFRVDSDPDKLARLKPSFQTDGTVTAGNSSQMADGAASVVVASAEAVEKASIRPSWASARPRRSRWRSSARSWTCPTSTCSRSTRPSPPRSCRTSASWAWTRTGSTSTEAASLSATRPDRVVPGSWSRCCTSSPAAASGTASRASASAVARGSPR